MFQLCGFAYRLPPKSIGLSFVPINISNLSAFVVVPPCFSDTSKKSHAFPMPSPFLAKHPIFLGLYPHVSSLSISLGSYVDPQDTTTKLVEVPKSWGIKPPFLDGFLTLRRWRFGWRFGCPGCWHQGPGCPWCERLHPVLQNVAWWLLWIMWLKQ